ncbi:hypothetical protein BH11PSE9_BH11PSE9_01230 [soil metagenome]
MTYTTRTAAAFLILCGGLLAACDGEKPEKLLSSAKSYLAQKDLSAATIQVKNALQLDPNSAEGRALLGTILFESKNFAAAEAEFQKSLALKYPADLVVPKLTGSLLAQGKYQKIISDFSSTELTSPVAISELQTNLSKSYAALNEPEKSDRALQAALTADSSYVPSLILQVRRMATRNEFPEALILLEKILQTAPSDPEAWKLKGDILQYGSKDIKGALDSYRKAVTVRSDYIPARIALLGIHLAQHKLDEAKNEVDGLRKVAPDDLQSKYAAAQYFYAIKDNKSAREVAQQLVKLLPDNPAVLQLAGAIDLQTNELVQAEARLARAVQLAPRLISARQLLVAAYLRSGQPEKALSTLVVAQSNGDLPTAMFSIAGEVYLQNGDNKRAQEYFSKASKLDPSDAGKRTTLALTRMIGGEVASAFDELQDIAASDKGVTADLALISAHLQRKEFNKAMTAIEALRAKRPNLPLASLLQGRTFLALNDLVAARKSFDEATKIDPSYFPAILSLASLDLLEKRPSVARNRLEEVLAKYPDNTQALIALAQLSGSLGGPADQAPKLLSRAITANSNEPLPRRLLIDFYLQQKDLKRASSSAQEAIAAIPDNPELLDALGRVQQESAEYNQALVTYNRLANILPSSTKVQLRLADVQVAARDTGAAERSLRKALEIKPGLLEAQLGLVMLNVSLKKFSEALAIARAVQKQHPKEPAGFLLEGDVALAQKNLDGAIAAYRAGLLVIQAPQLAVKLYATLTASGKSPEAEAFAASWLKGHPGDAMFLSYMGEMAIERRDYLAAEKRYALVTQLQPDNAAAFNNLAWVSDRLGKKSALDFAKKANEISPNQAPYLDTMATILAGDRQYSDAIAFQKKALELEPKNSQYRLNLGRLYAKSGDKKRAKDELDVLSTLGDKFPAQAEVQNLLKSL